MARPRNAGKIARTTLLLDSVVNAAEVRNGKNTSNPSHGVLKLTLDDAGYGWEFIPAPGSGGFRDSGNGTCFPGLIPEW